MTLAERLNVELGVLLGVGNDYLKASKHNLELFEASESGDIEYLRLGFEYYYRHLFTQEKIAWILEILREYDQ